MEVDPILSDDDIQILEVVNNDASTSRQSPEPEVRREVVPKNNPVEQNIIKQLNYANDLLTQTKNNIKIVEAVTDSILNNISVKTSYQEASSSDSDSDVSLLLCWMKSSRIQFYIHFCEKFSVLLQHRRTSDKKKEEPIVREAAGY